MVTNDDIGISSAFGNAMEDRFFDRDPVEVAPDLVGCLLLSTAGGEPAGGYVVETEAYRGADDPGSHASTKGVTARNAVMYGPPGAAYVYFTYGNHHMLNFVCCSEGQAGAVLIRALEPAVGLDVMARRRSRGELAQMCSGPGKLAQALGIDLSDNGVLLGMGRLHVYAGRRSEGREVLTSGRVGLSSGHELEYRFFERDNRFVSRGRTGPLPRRGRAGVGEG